MVAAGRWLKSNINDDQLLKDLDAEKLLDAAKTRAAERSYDLPRHTALIGLMGLTGSISLREAMKFLGAVDLYSGMDSKIRDLANVYQSYGLVEEDSRAGFKAPEDDDCLDAALRDYVFSKEGVFGG